MLPDYFIFSVVTYVSGYIFVCFCLIGLATGAMYIAEVMEEYPTLTKLVIRYTIMGMIAVHCGLWLIDGFPFLLVALGVFSHGVYYTLLARFPEFRFKSPGFIGSVICLALSCWRWWVYFRTTWFYGTEIFAFYGFCVWLVPILILLSMTAEDGLPMTAEHMSSSSSSSSASSASANGDHASLYTIRLNSLRSLVAWLKAKFIALLPPQMRARFVLQQQHQQQHYAGHASHSDYAHLDSHTAWTAKNL